MASRSGAPLVWERGLRDAAAFFVSCSSVLWSADGCTRLRVILFPPVRSLMDCDELCCVRYMACVNPLRCASGSSSLSGAYSQSYIVLYKSWRRVEMPVKVHAAHVHFMLEGAALSERVCVCGAMMFERVCKHQRNEAGDEARSESLHLFHFAADVVRLSELNCCQFMTLRSQLVLYPLLKVMEKVTVAGRAEGAAVERSTPAAALWVFFTGTGQI